MFSANIVCYMSHLNSIPIEKMIPVTEARRNLGELIDSLLTEKEFYLLRGGKIAAKLSLPESVRGEERRKMLKGLFGAWKRARIPADVWKRIKKSRKSRRKAFKL